MNSVFITGRMTCDPKVSYTNSNTAVARFNVAINRWKDKAGNDKGADFPSIICFGKTAELVEKYLGKGRLIGIEGRLQTGSYEKDGKKVYTTDVVAERVEFLDKTSESDSRETNKKSSGAPDGFSQLDEEIPF